MMPSEVLQKFNNGEYWFQIEEGDTPTKYEANVTAPTTNITIPSRSVGSRTYTAHWTKEYNITYVLDTEQWEMPQQHIMKILKHLHFHR